MVARLGFCSSFSSLVVRFAAAVGAADSWKIEVSVNKINPTPPTWPHLPELALDSAFSPSPTPPPTPASWNSLGLFPSINHLQVAVHLQADQALLHQPRQRRHQLGPPLATAGEVFLPKDGGGCRPEEEGHSDSRGGLAGASFIPSSSLVYLCARCDMVGDAVNIFDEMLQRDVSPVRGESRTDDANANLQQHKNSSSSYKVTWVVTRISILQNQSSGHANVLIRVEHRPPVRLSPPGMQSVFLRFDEDLHVQSCLSPVKHLPNLRLNTKPQEVPCPRRQPGGPPAGQSASTLEEALGCNRRGIAAGPRRLLPSLLCDITSELGIPIYLSLLWLMLQPSSQLICSAQGDDDAHGRSWSWAMLICTIFCNLAIVGGSLVALIVCSSSITARFM